MRLAFNGIATLELFMNIKINTLSIILLGTLLTGCANEENSPFGPSSNSGASSGTNIVSEKNFLMAYDEPNPAVIDDDGYHSGVEVVVTISAFDRSGLATTGATAYLDADWGTLSADSCVITSAGSCTITWTSNGNFDAPYFPGLNGLPPTLTSTVNGDELVAFTGWIVGEESFMDINDNNVFDDGDVFTTGADSNDTSGPYLDLNHDGAFTQGIDKVLIPGNSNATLTASNNLYDGPDCNHSTLCSGNSTIYISDNDLINIREAP